MGAIALRASGLGKQYRIGATRRRADTLRDSLAGAAAGWLQSFRRPAGGDAADKIWALRDLTFEVRRGDVLGIIGRNGAGKSTLLKILSRITEPTCGEVDVYGRVGSLLEVGTGFHPELTGRENIFLNGAVLGMRRAEIRRRLDEIIAFAEVERFIETPVKHYSTGMYMRLAFAVAAHLEPEILVVDEVLAVGDAEFQKKCLGKMREVAGGGRTVLFVSHNIAAVQNLCRSAMWLDQGQMRAWGTPAEVISQYFNEATAPAKMVIESGRSRQGSGAIHFTEVQLLGATGEVVRTFRCGEQAVFAVFYENGQKRDLRNLQVALGIDNQLGERIAYLSSDMTGANFASVPLRVGCVEVHIERWPLAAGRYGCTLFGSVNGVIADWVQNVGTFEVEGGDYYGTGRLPPPNQGPYLIDHYFSLRD